MSWNSRVKTFCFDSKTHWQMFLLLSDRCFDGKTHWLRDFSFFLFSVFGCCAHLNGHQHGVSMQIKLCKFKWNTFPNNASMNNRTDRLFIYKSSFISQLLYIYLYLYLFYGFISFCHYIDARCLWYSKIVNSSDLAKPLKRTWKTVFRKIYAQL